MACVRTVAYDAGRAGPRGILYRCRPGVGGTARYRRRGEIIRTPAVHGSGVEWQVGTVLLGSGGRGVGGGVEGGEGSWVQASRAAASTAGVPTASS